MRFFLFFISFFGAVSLAVPEEINLSKLFIINGNELGISSSLLEAISEVESNKNPYTLNVEGHGYYFDSKSAAIAAAKEAMRSRKSFDVGLMQINNQWLKKYDVDLDTVFDPAANIYLGAWILKQEIARQSNFWNGVAQYHSPDPERGNNYVELVKKALAHEQPESVDSKKKNKEFSSSPLVVYRKSADSVFVRKKVSDAQREQEGFIQRTTRK